MMSSSRKALLVGSLLLILMLSFPFTDAQFGLGKMKKEKVAAVDYNQVDVDVESVMNEMEDEGIEFDDPELLEAIEMFAGMSPEEMEETMQELIGMLGEDPETLAAIEEVMKEIPDMKAGDIQSSLNQMVSENEVATATKDALRLLGTSDWETIWEKQSLILDAVIQSGKMNAEDNALFKSDKVAWEKELRFIWNELQTQAASASKTSDEL